MLLYISVDVYVQTTILCCHSIRSYTRVHVTVHQRGCVCSDYYSLLSFRKIPHSCTCYCTSAWMCMFRLLFFVVIPEDPTLVYMSLYISVDVYVQTTILCCHSIRSHTRVHVTVHQRGCVCSDYYSVLSFRRIPHSCTCHCTSAWMCMFRLLFFVVIPEDPTLVYMSLYISVGVYVQTPDLEEILHSCVVETCTGPAGRIHVQIV